MTVRTIHLSYLYPEEFDTSKGWLAVGGLSGAQQYIKGVRDYVRADLSAASVLDDATGYTVSDLWEEDNGTYKSYGFILRDNANNIEWAYLVGESTNTNAPDVDDWLGASGSNLRQHVRTIGTVSPSTSPPSGNVLFFNPDISTSTAATGIGFDDLVALTFTGGDWTAPGITIDSLAGLQALRPSHAPYGYDTASLPTDDLCMTWHLDDTEGVMIAEFGETTMDTRYMCILGLAVDPLAGGDTNEAVTGWHQLSAATPGSNQGEFTAFDSGGTLRTYDWDIAKTQFTTSNHLIDEGGTDKYDWRTIDLVNGSGSSGTKGSIKEDIACQIGAEGSVAHGMVFTQGSNRLVRVGSRWAFMTQEDAPMFGFKRQPQMKT